MHRPPTNSQPTPLYSVVTRALHMDQNTSYRFRDETDMN